MKSVSSKYNSAETITTLYPAELFHIWRDGGSDWRYTSGDISVDYDGNTYVPATIKRGSVSYVSNLEIQRLRIDIGYLEDPILEFIALNPVEILWISVMRIHRNISPIEASVIFIGQITEVSFKENQATATCLSFDNFLKQEIPKSRYQISCNNKLGDTKCGYKIDEGTLDAELSALSVDGLTLTSDEFLYPVYVKTSTIDPLSALILSPSAGYRKTESNEYEVEITTGGVTDPNIFRWRKNEGSWNSGISVSTSPIRLGSTDEPYIKFNQTTGGVIGDIWNVSALYSQDNFYTRGYIEFEDSYRMVVNHSGNEIKIRYKIVDLISTDTVNVSVGCNRLLETCVDKFDRILNFFGMPFIPLDNPTTWT